MLFKIWYPLKLQFLTNKMVLGGNQSKLGKQGNPTMYPLEKNRRRRSATNSVPISKSCAI